MEENQTPTSPIAGEPALLKPGMVVPRGALMALRATLHHALCDFADYDGLPVEQLPWDMKAHDLAAAVGNAHEQVTALLGITEPADEDPYAGDAEGEMRAEAEAERRADAALELAAELASCDWEGWD